VRCHLRRGGPRHRGRRQRDHQQRFTTGDPRVRPDLHRPGRRRRDTIDGGAQSDTLFGGLGNDTVRGGADDDHLEGNVGADTVYGGDGQDDILGGTSPLALAGASSSGTPDTGDTLLSGENDPDVILGDNGLITRSDPPLVDGVDPTDVPAIRRAVRMYDVTSGHPLVGGDDAISGGASDDLLFGQVGNDTVNGDAGNDHIEGNNGADTLSGGDGQDDVVGGTTPLALDPSTPTSAVVDIGDLVVNGDGGADYLAGDNASVVHPLTGSGQWKTAPADGSFLRTVTLLDRETDGGGDAMDGGAGNDRMWGEVGADLMNGGADDDYLEGNLGSDAMSGGTGSDDMIGGTSPVALPPGANNDPVAANSSDVGDTMYGLASGESSPLTDDDTMVGDNGRVDRCAPVSGQPSGRDDCPWTHTSYGLDKTGATALGNPVTRYVTLLGESATEATHAGSDYLEGDSGNDVLYGEDGSDALHGDTPAAGSPRRDECLPTSDANAGQDILFGGYGGDAMCGDGAQDALLGDRGIVNVAPFSGPTVQINTAGPPNITASYPSSGDTLYQVTLVDPTVGGNDSLFGGQGDDSLHGGAGNDFIQGDDGLHAAGQPTASGGDDIAFGDNGQDSIEGGPGNDHVFGGANEDDLDVTRGTVASSKVDNTKRSLPPLYATIADYAGRFPLASGGYDGDPGATDRGTPIADIVYGGFDRDVMQADTLGDRLVDSYGSYNLFYVCPAAYGGAGITRAVSPGIQAFFKQLAQADGALGAATSGTSGYDELSFVYPATANPDNAGPAYPTTPGHFTC